MSEPKNLWGLATGRCAWCGLCYATKSYIDYHLNNKNKLEAMRFNVCDVCYVDYSHNGDVLAVTV